ncbi:uncharacterized protein LOC141613485 [Silene latifolia]|uniref:uncharacterized protein LOC141613485 n=1 Tax=Silene latifolia TaxID=37657 RepID=UPI003D788838
MVEIDVSKDFVDQVVINTPFLGQITQKIVYEWVPFYCSSCGKLGHKSSTCKWLKKSQHDSDQQAHVPVPELGVDLVSQKMDAQGEGTHDSECQVLGQRSPLTMTPSTVEPVSHSECSASLPIQSVSDNVRLASPKSQQRNVHFKEVTILPVSNQYQALGPGEISQVDDIVLPVLPAELGGTSDLVQDGIAAQIENPGSGCDTLGQHPLHDAPIPPDIRSDMHSGSFADGSPVPSGSFIPIIHSI